MAPHSSILAWKIPWMEEPGRLQSMESRSRTPLSDFTFTFHSHALEKDMATHSGVLAWRIPGMGKPGGLPSLRSHRLRHDWSDLAAAALFSVVASKLHYAHFILPLYKFICRRNFQKWNFWAKEHTFTSWQFLPSRHRGGANLDFQQQHNHMHGLGRNTMKTYVPFIYKKSLF